MLMYKQNRSTKAKFTSLIILTLTYQMLDHMISWNAQGLFRYKLCKKETETKPCIQRPFMPHNIYK